MKPTRVAVILMLAFLFGGSSAEVAVQAKRAIDRHRAAREPGSAGALVALELRGGEGEVVARPRVISAPGRAARLVLRDPLDPAAVRLALRITTAREPSGDLSVAYEVDLPSAELHAAGTVVVEPGVERTFTVGEGALTATLLALPVPSAAFDAYLEAERARRAAHADAS
jgi:hypothetical protein